MVLFFANVLRRFVAHRSRLRRHYGSLDYTEFEESGHRTTVELKSKTSVRDPLIFTKYLVGGFRFQEATIMGPIAIISNGVFGWNVTHPQEINIGSLAFFSMVFPKIDIVIIGTGDTFYPLPQAVHQEMKQRGVSLEVQQTQNACGVYNVLRGERPMAVAGAFIPMTEQIFEKKKSISAQKRYFLGM